MENSANTKVLLVVVVMLVAIKFGVMPVLQWQNQTIEEIAQHEKRVAKSQRLIDSQPQLLKQLAEHSSNYQAQIDVYPVFPDSSTFRLETQMNFEMLLKVSDLRRQRMFWRSDTDEVAHGNLYKASFNVDFAGNFKDAALFHSQLLNEYPQYRVLNMSYGVRGQKEQSMGFTSTTFTVAAYYWRGKKQ